MSGDVAIVIHTASMKKSCRTRWLSSFAAAAFECDASLLIDQIVSVTCVFSVTVRGKRVRDSAVDGVMCCLRGDFQTITRDRCEDCTGSSYPTTGAETYTETYTTETCTMNPFDCVFVGRTIFDHDSSSSPT